MKKLSDIEGLSCKNCLYFDACDGYVFKKNRDDDYDFGTCRRYPPVYVGETHPLDAADIDEKGELNPDDWSIKFQFPWVISTSSCGEFKKDTDDTDDA